MVSTTIKSSPVPNQVVTEKLEISLTGDNRAFIRILDGGREAISMAMLAIRHLPKDIKLTLDATHVNQIAEFAAQIMKYGPGVLLLSAEGQERLTRMRFLGSDGNSAIPKFSWNVRNQIDTPFLKDNGSTDRFIALVAQSYDQELASLKGGFSQMTGRWTQPKVTDLISTAEVDEVRVIKVHGAMHQESLLLEFKEFLVHELPESRQCRLDLTDVNPEEKKFFASILVACKLRKARGSVPLEIVGCRSSMFTKDIEQQMGYQLLDTGNSGSAS